MQAKLDAEQDDVYAGMQALIDEVPVIAKEPPSAELQLRRELAEHAIWSAATAEVMARPYEEPDWAKRGSDTEWQAWMMTDSYVDADRALSTWAWINDPEAQERSRERMKPLLQANRDSDATATAAGREIESLVFSRMPNWETDEPPPLLPWQKAILDECIAAGPTSLDRFCIGGGPVLTALDEIRKTVR